MVQVLYGPGHICHTVPMYSYENITLRSTKPMIIHVYLHQLIAKLPSPYLKGKLKWWIPMNSKELHFQAQMNVLYPTYHFNSLKNIQRPHKSDNVTKHNSKSVVAKYWSLTIWSLIRIETYYIGFFLYLDKKNLNIM